MDYLVELSNQILRDLFGFRTSGQATRAFWSVALGATTAVSCAILGCYLLLRRLSLLGDAISHGVLPGIALAFVFSGSITGWAILVGAILFGMLTAFLTESISTLGKVPEDASLGVVYTSLFALGVVIVAQLSSKAHIDADCILYGQLEAVILQKTKLWGYNVPPAVRPLGLALLLTLIFVTLLWKELKLVSFDPALATAMGFKAALLHYLLMGMVSAVTVASFEVVGSILVIAMLIVPAATAHLLTDRFSRMVGLAVVVALLSAFFGYTGARIWKTNTAGMMTAVAGLQFLLAVLLAPRHGVVSKILRNARLGLRILREDVLAQLYRAEERSTAVTLQDLRETAPGMAGRLALRMLHWKGFLEPGPKLTERGRRHAVTLVRTHRLWERFLDEKLHLPPDHVHEPAHQMEHYIGPELREHLESQLEEAKVDPHGREIPPSPRNGED